MGDEKNDVEEPALYICDDGSNNKSYCHGNNILGFHHTKESAQEVVGESIYILFLVKNPFTVLVALAFYAVQLSIVILFGQVDWSKEITKVAICRDDIVEPVCEGVRGLSTGEFFLVIMVLFIHTGGEIAKGIQLIALALNDGKRDLISRRLMLLLGLGIGALAGSTFGVAANFVLNKSDNFVLAVGDVFILLFVLDCDEKAFDMIKYWNRDYAKYLLVNIEAEQ